MDPMNCPKCAAIVTPNSNYCFNCGTALSEKAVHIPVGRQIWMYFVSAFLPPLGLSYTFKYLLSKHPQHQRIAVISTILTVASILITIWATVGTINAVQSQLNTQLKSYQNIGL